MLNPIPALEWKLAFLLVFNQGLLRLLLLPLLVVVVDEDVVQLEKNTLFSPIKNNLNF